MKKFALALTFATLVLSAVQAHAGGLELPIISISPSSYDFGNVPVSAVAAGSITVTNLSADSDLVVDAVKTKAPFSDDTTSFTLAPGHSRVINLAFAPTAPVTYNSVCTIQSNASNGTVKHIPLTGTGVE
jgi:hypothetical protein